MQASLIIPAYNEETRLPSTLEDYEETMRRRFGDDFEIIVVANGSIDNTVGVATDTATSLPHIRVFEIEDPVGKGGAILEGFRQARGERILFADADEATAPESLLELFDELDRHDIVIGSRRLDDSTITRPQPLLRRAFGLVFAKATRLLFGLPFEDTQCGAKAFRRPVAQQLARVVDETHWAFDLDLLLWARKQGFVVREHPVVWTDKEGSQLKFGSTAYAVLRVLGAMKLREAGSRAARAARRKGGFEQASEVKEVQ